ncbi:Silver-binding protein [Enterobacter asburiae]|uniref:Silver-binding protein n=1 Tax=Enterobacter asburiae TaxID=61645 RepID=UPI00192CACAB|nr:Silver-binding protein [Enterobacter asburiae]MBL5944409.1 Silver-binding protein [Enterobacter asburiae]MBL5952676.1 Silver-binding protein [Enterobacter asburiae]
MKKIFLSVIAILAVSASGWAAETNSKQAAMSHDMMQSNTSNSSQSMAEMHKEMIKTSPCSTNETATSFSAMNEHEKAAIAHETANNGQSSVSHQQQAQHHRRQMTEN